MRHENQNTPANKLAAVALAAIMGVSAVNPELPKSFIDDLIPKGSDKMTEMKLFPAVSGGREAGKMTREETGYFRAVNSEYRGMNLEEIVQAYYSAPRRTGSADVVEEYYKAASAGKEDSKRGAGPTTTGGGSE